MLVVVVLIPGAFNIYPNSIKNQGKGSASWQTSQVAKKKLTNKEGNLIALSCKEKNNPNRWTSSYWENHPFAADYLINKRTKQIAFYAKGGLRAVDYTGFYEGNAIRFSDKLYFKSKWDSNPTYHSKRLSLDSLELIEEVTTIATHGNRANKYTHKIGSGECIKTDIHYDMSSAFMRTSSPSVEASHIPLKQALKQLENKHREKQKTQFMENASSLLDFILPKRKACIQWRQNYLEWASHATSLADIEDLEQPTLKLLKQAGIDITSVQGMDDIFQILNRVERICNLNGVDIFKPLE